VYKQIGLIPWGEPEQASNDVAEEVSIVNISEDVYVEHLLAHLSESLKFGVAGAEHKLSAPVFFDWWSGKSGFFRLPEQITSSRF
jgi:hypothetical protein